MRRANPAYAPEFRAWQHDCPRGSLVEQWRYQERGRNCPYPPVT